MNLAIKYIACTLILLVSNLCFAATRTWIGNTSSNWTTAANWQGNAIPSGFDNVIINSTGTYRPITNISGSILSLTMNTNSGTIALTGDLQINGLLLLNGGNVQLNTYNLDVIDITLNNGTLALDGVDISITGNLTLSGGTLDLGGATMNLGGDILVTSNSTIQSKGLSMLNATSSLLTINEGNLMLNDVEVLIDNLTFSSNHFINSKNNGFLSFDNSTQHSINGSTAGNPGLVDNSAHVNAKVRLYTNNGNTNTFYFPIGDGTVYSPFIFTPTNVPNSANPLDNWVEATYYGNESAIKSIDYTTINSLSPHEYWTATSSDTSIIGNVALRYDNNIIKTGKSILTSIGNLNTDLLVAEIKNNKWEGMGSTINTTLNITLVSSSTTSPNNSYTLASNNSRTGFLIALPLNILNFKVIPITSNHTVAINWQNVFDENCKYFDIMHSIDNINWKTIGSIKNSGLLNELTSFRFIDYQPAGVNFYKLKAVDKTGDYIYSEIRIAKFNEVSEKMKLYPNPANQYLTINCNPIEINNDLKIQLINQLGQVVFEESIENSNITILSKSINIADVPAGLYHLNIIGVNNFLSEKIIINH